MENSIKTQWVTGKYTGAQAKSVSAQAHAGIGYFVLDKPEKGDSWVTVAFPRAIDSPLPDYLQEVMNPRMVEKLNQLRQDRQGTKLHG